MLFLSLLNTLPLNLRMVSNLKKSKCFFFTLHISF